MRFSPGRVGVVFAALLLAACSSNTASDATSQSASSASPAVTGNECPMVFDASEADFYPIQPSFSAGYTASMQHLSSDTQDWAYVISGDFPYSQWMAWYTYTEKGVPLVKLSDSAILPDEGSTNPFVEGNPILAPKRSYTIYMMPNSTPASVISSMQNEGKNVVTLPSASTTPDVAIVSRSYWPFSNDGLGDYTRFGYGGPTNTPTPTLKAYLTDASTGEITTNPVDDCGSQSAIPQEVWFNPQTNSPIVTFKDAPRPTEKDLQDIPRFLVQTGSFSGSIGKEFPPSPVPDEVQFYRNVAASAPFADVQSAPPPGNPPDACGGYVMANLPNDVVSLVRIPKVPTFPNYQGATAKTLNKADDYNVAFYSIVIYGAEKQVDAYGTTENSQIGNRQIALDSAGGATVVLYPNKATSDEIAKIDAVVKANGWNMLKSGVQTTLAPNLLVIREKGQNPKWKKALSTNDVTAGAPCPQSSDPSLPLPQNPPSAQVTQFNGMGLTAPQGQNCTVEEFLSGKCLKDFGEQLAQTGAKWSSQSATPPEQKAAP